MQHGQLSLHDIVKFDVKEGRMGDTTWKDYIFTDSRGSVFTVVAFDTKESNNG